MFLNLLLLKLPSFTGINAHSTTTDKKNSCTWALKSMLTGLELTSLCYIFFLLFFFPLKS